MKKGKRTNQPAKPDVCLPAWLDENSKKTSQPIGASQSELLRSKVFQVLSCLEDCRRKREERETRERGAERERRRKTLHFTTFLRGGKEQKHYVMFFFLQANQKRKRRGWGLA